MLHRNRIIMSSYNKTDRARFIDICIQKGIKGVGLYNTFTHIDIGGKRAWDRMVVEQVFQNFLGQYLL